MRAGVGPRAATPALSGALGTFTTETPPRGTYLLQNLPRGAATVLSAQRAPRPLGGPGPASLPLPWAISTRPASLWPGWAGNGHLPGGREPSPGGSSYWTCPHPALHRPGVGTVHPLRTRVCLPKPGHSERHLHSGRVVRGSAPVGEPHRSQVRETLFVCCPFLSQVALPGTLRSRLTGVGICHIHSHVSYYVSCLYIFQMYGHLSPGR